MAGTRAGGKPWSHAVPAPIVLVTGPEELLAERAVGLIADAVRDARGSTSVTRLNAASAGPGALRAATGPSLFDDSGLVVVEALETLTDDFSAQVVDYAASPDPEAVVVFLHSGVVRGKRALDSIRAAGGLEYTAAAVTKAADFVDFVAAEFARTGAKAGDDAVRALIDAVGQDVAELAACVAQLGQDVGKRITVEDVARYYGTRVNATGFAVADAAAVGKSAEALALTRHALESGTDPVPLVAALAAKLRTLAKVGASRGRGLDPVRDLGLAPWMVDRARRELRGWNAERLARAIEQVAAADADVKGAGRSPEYAVERAVLAIASLAADAQDD